MIHNSSPKSDHIRYKVWEEWMGYVVHFNKDGQVYIDQRTSYGVSRERAMDAMKDILLSGDCAWIMPMNPAEMEDIPF